MGFQCVDVVSKSTGIKMSERRRLVVIGQGKIGLEEVILAKPRTFMNRSGEALSYLVNRFHISTDDMLVVYDDMNLSLGKIRIRSSGSSGGHRGMESIIDALGSQNFPRVRVGISRPTPGVNDVEFVLGTFDDEETPLVKRAVSTTRDAVVDVIIHGFEWAMNRYN